MPDLRSFITGRKNKAPIKSPFAIGRWGGGEPSTSTAPPPPPVPPLPAYLTSEVIDIGDQSTRYSLDFDGGKPVDEYEKDLVDEEPRFPRPDTTVSPQVQLDIELSPEGLTDWFAANFLTPGDEGPEQVPNASASGSRTEASRAPLDVNVAGGKNGISSKRESMDDDGLSYTTSSEDVLTTLKSMDPSHFGKLPGYDSFNRLEQSSPRKPSPNSITIPGGTPKNQNNEGTPANETPGISRSSRPMSMIDTPASSAISGTTLARALMSNPFILSDDNRASAYRSMAGLTRTDSTTLPRGEHSFGAAFSDDRFSIGPDAPPIPPNADSVYEPPKKPRTPSAEVNKRKQMLKRRSSTGSVHPSSKSLPDTPSAYSTRPNSLVLSPGMEFDLNSLLKSPDSQKPPSLPRSPLPPTPKLPYSAAASQNSFTQESISGSSQEAIQQFPLSPDLNQFSPTPSSEGPLSAKNLEDVLNYYSAPDSPEPLITGANYRPAFSPISEESSSQLSPPTPYRNEKRESQRNAPIGARSPLSSNTRLRGESVPLPQTPSVSRNLTPQAALGSGGSRPQSVTQIPSPASSHGSSFAAAGNDLLAPPPMRSIFNRERAGSAPSPIKVVRDPKDSSAYNITISPQILEGETPTSEEGDNVAQRFPETPSAFSPLLTTDTNGSPGVQQSLHGLEVLPMANGPLSATLPGRNQPSLAQQIFLNRAGTTIGKHSRQTSVSQIKTIGLGAPSGSPSNRHIADIAEEPSSSPIEPVTKPELIVEAPAETVLSSSPVEMNSNAEPSNAASSVVDLSRSPSRSTTTTQTSDANSMYASSTDSLRGVRMKTLPAIPISPLTRSPAVSSSASSIIASSPTPIPESVLPTTTPPAASTTPIIPPPPVIPPPSPTPSQKERVRPPPVRGKLPPALTISNPSTSRSNANTVAVNGTDTATETSPASVAVHDSPIPPIPAPNPDIPAPAPPTNIIHSSSQSSLVYSNDSSYSGRGSDIFRGTSLGSPPPYYTVVAIDQPEPTPSTGFSQAPPVQTPSFSHSMQTAPIVERSVSGEHSGRGPAQLARESSIQRPRMRPPLPTGPRRPSQMMSGGFFMGPRDRAGSISSVASGIPPMVSSRNRPAAEPGYSPKFQTPSPKWRGYTMEAAKWTFTSAQLQAIVSRAIRQSAEASSIRLLRLEILDEEIPEELQRLQSQRTDLKTRYKVLVRRRATLFDGLFACAGGVDEDSAAHVLRLTEDLRDLTTTLDRLTEELHSLDGQIAHLESLTHIHNGSALAMALRKLNASFLKQVGENQALRNQVEALEAERNEAWQQAEHVANEFDRLMDKGDDVSSKRSSRVSAVRKSSVRVSKAGLRTTSQRFSQLSSHSAGLHALGLPPSARSPLLRLDRVPPVPPIPRRQPNDINFDSPLKSSAALSPNDLTPTSETRALVQAQDELYAMLGLSNPERPLRRSFSVGMLSAGLSPSVNGHFPSATLSRPGAERSNSWRRSSLPGGDALAETYNAMAADRNAVLATIDMLSLSD
ncbi:hypothetical protein D9613_011176 [Agrocybe pediades]|uniref:Uncharacterized protein n=1 Tax=Agrocybe pediades TaxID=84607 RepID=A0A8H4QL68_9AGAR|nr:hypothetical protein D9613_011176 [Agrocybe pediades]